MKSFIILLLAFAAISALSTSVNERRMGGIGDFIKKAKAEFKKVVISRKNEFISCMKAECPKVPSSIGDVMKMIGGRRLSFLGKLVKKGKSLAKKGVAMACKKFSKQIVSKCRGFAGKAADKVMSAAESKVKGLMSKLPKIVTEKAIPALKKCLKLTVQGTCDDVAVMVCGGKPKARPAVAAAPAAAKPAAKGDKKSAAKPAAKAAKGDKKSAAKPAAKKSGKKAAKSAKKPAAKKSTKKTTKTTTKKAGKKATKKTTKKTT